MKNSSKALFNTIYIEEEAYKYPIATKLLEKYSDCTIVPIKHYKDVFNRSNQYFSIQKKHQALILAVKNEPFLYKGPDVCQNFGYTNFYYTSFLLNCIFDCEYCYLQGMYPSANLVAFVNIKDFQSAIENILLKEKIFLAASYDTDLIGFHNVIPYFDYFYDFFADKPRLITEIRTKSANKAFYERYKPLDNLIIAFTLAPDEIIQKYEKHTSSLDSRIDAINTAIKFGFKVRICLDPIFINPKLNSLYEPFYNYIFTKIDPDKIVDVGFGFFRMSKEFFKRIEKLKKNSELFSEDYSIMDDVATYSIASQEKLKAEHIKLLTKYIKKEKIFSL